MLRKRKKNKKTTRKREREMWKLQPTRNTVIDHQLTFYRFSPRRWSLLFLSVSKLLIFGTRPLDDAAIQTSTKRGERKKGQPSSFEFRETLAGARSFVSPSQVQVDGVRNVRFSKALRVGTKAAERKRKRAPTKGVKEEIFQGVSRHVCQY